MNPNTVRTRREPSAPSSKSSQTGLPPSCQRHSTILVIDDDEGHSELIAFCLRAAGYERVLSAPDASKALALIRQSPPDLLIVDIKMPRMSGTELVRLLNADRTLEPIAFVIVTGKRGCGEEARNLGALACLEKPLDASALLRVVAQHLPTTKLSG